MSVPAFVCNSQTWCRGQDAVALRAVSTSPLSFCASNKPEVLLTSSIPLRSLQVAFSGEGTRGGTEGEQMVRDLQVRIDPVPDSI